ncbi:MAG: phage holin family protein, partial [Planctomycetota bacterium]
DVGNLVRQEIDLARCELAEKAEEAKGGVARVGLGGGLAFIGALVLAGAAVLGLTFVLQRWMETLPAMAVSALAVGIVLAGAGLVLLKSGTRSLSPEHLVPRRTLDSIKEDARWARRQF